MEPGLQLLMRDGPIRVTFRSALTAEEYAELMRIADQSTTRAELRDALAQATRIWSKVAEYEEVGH